MIRYDARLEKYNSFHDGKKRDLGIIACGITNNYLLENISGSVDDYPVLKVTTYPFPDDLMKRYCRTMQGASCS